MKLRGPALLPAPRERVWQSLTDPHFLAKCLPGAQELTPDGPGRYKVSMKMGIAAFSGKFRAPCDTLISIPRNRLRSASKAAARPAS